jgi:hypothetical protein
MTLPASSCTVRLVVPILGDGPGDLGEVAGVDGCEELDLVVPDEEALVAVGGDRDLGDDVAGEPEHTRAVDEVAPEVGLLLADAHAQVLTTGSVRSVTSSILQRSVCRAADQRAVVSAASAATARVLPASDRP